MTETVLALIPTYGLVLIFAVIALACVAVPLPASMVTLAAGAFAASGDLALWEVLASSFAAFVIGDQLAFFIASRAGPGILDRLARHPRFEKPLTKSRDMIEAKGQMAVLLSHTLFSPTCPYVSYLCGAGGLSWARFSGAAVLGALIWTVAYVGLGYIFATQLSQVASILSQFFGLLLAVAGLGLAAHWLRQAWRAHTQEHA